jgi:NAD(P)-dependent dehydrogenase (short-subunit alcohol dehydrogenase family)
MTNLPASFAALIVGASRGIGAALVQRLLDDPRCGRVWAACRRPEQALAPRVPHADRLRWVALDVTDEDSVRAAADQLRAAGAPLHLLIHAAGVLHDAAGMAPERRLADVDPAAVARSFRVNALGPLLVAKHFIDVLTHGERAVLANLSARVGSIGDNRLGGWYAYRAAKSAQNQFTRTLAIEAARRAPRLICVALHPGTVDTDLSRPFRSRVPADRLFDADRAAAQLLCVIEGLDEASSGRFFAWDGAEIPW